MREYLKKAVPRQPDADEAVRGTVSEILRGVRESHGSAIAVSEAEIVAGVKEAAAAEGLFMAPESGACVAAARKLAASGQLSPDDNVVLFDTGTGYKYVENMAPLW